MKTKKTIEHAGGRCVVRWLKCPKCAYKEVTYEMAEGEKVVKVKGQARVRVRTDAMVAARSALTALTEMRRKR